MNTITKFTAVAVCALTLAACGGGNEHYTITPSVSGGGGTIDPSRDFLAPPDVNLTFLLTPDAGYAVASVGGTCGGTLNGNLYTTNAITDDCTVVATFAAVSKALTFRYETQPDPGNSVDFLKLLNQEGAKGYSYLFDNNNNYYNTHGLDDLRDYSLPFVNDGSGQVYSYELLNVPGNMADFITQANEEGARGYRYDAIVGWVFVMDINNNLPTTYTLGAGILYRKDSSSSATYTYALEPATDNVSDQVVQASQRGQSGYLLILPRIARVSVNGADLYNLYVKNNSSNAVYVYESNTSVTLDKELLAQLNSEGAKGYRTLPGNWRIYVKDQSQNATFAYQSAPENLTLDQMNSYGMQGYAYWGQYAGNTANAYYYVKANNCKGLLCTVSNPAVRNSVAW